MGSVEETTGKIKISAELEKLFSQEFTEGFYLLIASNPEEYKAVCYVMQNVQFGLHMSEKNRSFQFLDMDKGQPIQHPKVISELMERLEAHTKKKHIIVVASMNCAVIDNFDPPAKNILMLMGTVIARLSPEDAKRIDDISDKYLSETLLDTNIWESK